jgi:Rrf2 family protein
VLRLRNFPKGLVAIAAAGGYLKPEYFNPLCPVSPMRLSSMADYAVVAMTEAARHCGCGPALGINGKRGPALTAGQIAEETGLPLPTVQKLVSRLTAAGLLRSSRGVGGGLQLARPAAAISLADIIEAVEGPIALTACVEAGNGARRGDCTLEEACRVRPHWGVVNAAMRGALAAVPLSRLARDLAVETA